MFYELQICLLSISICEYMLRSYICNPNVNCPIGFILILKYIRSFKMSSKKSSYLDSIHILFKVKSTGDYTVGTAGMISLPKLPLENLVLLDKIQSLMDSKAEIKIRYSFFYLIKENTFRNKHAGFLFSG